MLRVDKLLESLESAEYISTLDLTKGYWEMPLMGVSQEKTTSPIPFSFYQFMTMAFSWHGVAFSFQQ